MFVIGSTLKPNEALHSLKDKCGEFNFPQDITVENFMPRDIVGAGVGLFLDSNLKSGGVTKRKVKFPTFGHLMEFVTDMEVLAKLNKFERAVGLTFAETETKTETETETEDDPPEPDHSEADTVPADADPSNDTVKNDTPEETVKLGRRKQKTRENK